MSAPDTYPSDTTLQFLRTAFPEEWREPPLGEAAVAAWEAENGVTLPEPYRTFVAEIGNGCALGPAGDGGLQPLGVLPDGWPGLGPRRPGEPFPLDAAWNWEDDETVDPDGDPRTDAAYNDGSVVLGSEDGATYWLLVTAGPRRGEVRMVGDVGAAPAPGDPAWGFEEWVRHWHAGHEWWD